MYILKSDSNTTPFAIVTNLTTNLVEAIKDEFCGDSIEITKGLNGDLDWGQTLSIMVNVTEGDFTNTQIIEITKVICYEETPQPVVVNPQFDVNENNIPISAYNYFNSLNLRSDLENDNVRDCIFTPKGYVGNRPSDFEGKEHEDDTWAIDCVDEDGLEIESYLYCSEFEYNEDVKLLKRYWVLNLVSSK